MQIKAIMSWHTAWKVCRGFRNLSYQKSKKVSRAIGCPVDVFMDPDKKNQRLRLEQQLMDSGLVRPRKPQAKAKRK